MKILFDLFPVILFFVTYKILGRGNGDSACLIDKTAHLPWTEQPILVATTVAIIATFVQVTWLIAHKKKVDTMLWVSLAIVTLFGGATLYFQNPIFIQWKPTILYWFFAAALIGAPIVAGRNIIKSMMETQMQLPNHIWRNLNLAWAIFFFGLGFANIAAIHWLSCNNWVTFKLFGTTGIMLVFIILQAAMVAKHIESDKKEHH